MALIKPFIDSKPLMQNITVVSWNQLVYVANFGGDKYGCVKGSNNSLYGLNLYDISVPTFTNVFGELVDFWDKNPDLRATSRWETEKFATRVTRSIPDEATAYPYRNANAFRYELL
jgi:hypothetical protein